jgi:hypothetical protein
MTRRRRAAELRDRTTAAAGKWAASRPAPAVSGLLPPGSVVMLDADGELMEWVVLEVDTASGRILAVPADTSPLVGGADVTVASTDPCGPLTLRCRLYTWLDAAQVSPDCHSGRVEPEVVELSRARVRQLQGALPSAAPLEETDLDPEYQDLMAELGHSAAAGSILRSSSVSPAAASGSAARLRGAPWRRPAVAMALSSLSLVLAAALIGQSRENAALRRERDALRLGAAQVAASLPPGNPGGAEPSPTSDAALLPSIPNVPWTVLDPVERVRGRSGQARAIPSAEYFLILLNLGDTVRHREYEVQIWPAGARAPSSTIVGLKPASEDGMLSLAVPGRDLQAGEYRLRLFAVGPQGPRPVHDYLLSISASASSSSVGQR